MSREPIHKEQSGRYVVVVDTAAPGESRRQTRRRFDTRKEARAWLSQTRVQLAEQRFVTPASTTLAQWVEAWLPVLRTRVRPSTASSYERNLRLHVLPALGHKPLQLLRPADLTAVYADLLADGRLDGRGQRSGVGLSVRSVYYVHTIARSCLQSALENDLLQRNPADRAKPPKASAGGSKHAAFRA